MRAAIFLVTFLTGASGLIYQVVWQRYLTRVLGAETLSTALVLAVFLSGLSLGYYLCGRWSLRVRSPLRAYAILEVAVGFWGLAFPFWYAAVSAATGSWSFAPVAGMVTQGLVVTVLLIGLPAVAMGGTVPLLTRGLAATLAGASRVHATLYAVNTGGAFLGTLAAGYYLVYAYGLAGGLFLAAAINFVAAAVFYLASKTTAFAEAPEEAVADAAPEPSRFAVGQLYAIGFLSGFYVMALENFFFRICGIAFGAAAHIFALVVAVFVLAIALGSLWAGRRALTHRSLPANQFVIFGCVLALYPLLDAWTYYGYVLRTLFQLTPFGFWAYQAAILGFLMLVLLVPVAAMGATLPMAFHELKRELRRVGDHSGRLLACNGIGACLGSLVGGIIIFLWFDLGGAYLFCLTAIGLSAALISWPLGKRWRTAGLGATGIAVLLLAWQPGWQEERFAVGYFRTTGHLSGLFEGPTAFYADRLAGSPIIFQQTGAGSTVAVLEAEVVVDDQVMVHRNLYHNGRSESAVQGTDLRTTRLLAHVPMLLASDPRQTLVIGLGTGVTAAECLRYDGVERVAVAEISTTVTQALPYFADATRSVHEHPQLEILHGDAWRILRRSEQKWDAIISEPSNLYVVGVDQLFTQEFYALVRSRLAEDGVFMQWIHGYGMDPAGLALPLRALMAEFANLYCFANELDVLILATPEPLGPDDLQRAFLRLRDHPEVGAALAEVEVADLSTMLQLLMPEFLLLPVAFPEQWKETVDHPKVAQAAYRHMFLNTNPAPALAGLRASPLATALRARYQRNWTSEQPEPILPLPIPTR